MNSDIQILVEHGFVYVEGDEVKILWLLSYSIYTCLATIYSLHI